MYRKPAEGAECYFAIIDSALKARGRLSDDYVSDPVHREPCYVVRMCESLVTAIGETSVDLTKVMRMERCASGHTDYHTKLALYCRELKRGQL